MKLKRDSRSTSNLKSNREEAATHSNLTHISNVPESIRYNSVHPNYKTMKSSNSPSGRNTSTMNSIQLSGSRYLETLDPFERRKISKDQTHVNQQNF